MSYSTHPICRACSSTWPRPIQRCSPTLGRRTGCRNSTRTILRVWRPILDTFGRFCSLKQAMKEHVSLWLSRLLNTVNDGVFSFSTIGKIKLNACPGGRLSSETDRRHSVMTFHEYYNIIYYHPLNIYSYIFHVCHVAL